MSLRYLKLKPRMILIMGLVALLQTGLIGASALHYLSQMMDEQISLRASNVATSVANMPRVIERIKQRDSDYLQPLSLSLAKKLEARYVVVADHQGIRFSHPRPKEIGFSMLADEQGGRALHFPDGKAYSYTAEGSLGVSVRARAPVYDNDGSTLIGVVSVGYLKTRVEQIIDRYRQTLATIILVAFLFSVAIAIWFANHFKKAIFNLEPEQIGQLFAERNVTLHSVREGILAINAAGKITTFNRAAIDTLNLHDAEPLEGKSILNVLPDSQMMEVLETGELAFDHEIWLQDQCLIVNRLPLVQNGQIIGAVSSFRRKDELDTVSKQLTRIQQYADTLRSQSHEYNNKLHTIAGLIEIGATDKALALIGQETQNHQVLIQLLMNAIPDPILAGCLLGKYNRAREMGLHLQLDPDSHMTELPDRPPREQLVSILSNLIDNALEATLQHKGPGGQVFMTMTDLGNDLIFEVEDEGAGIDQQWQQHIFEKGVSSKAAEGRGIGLHLVRQLLTQLEGSITIESGEYGGSRFTVYIPKQGRGRV
ncbi:histidine kinase [Endozoicomonas sp. (ex Bugula neritina AB1)]|nr:histidine kinase [Endozoicomonas sp. (ex Bugula neritina AB1)]